MGPGLDDDDPQFKELVRQQRARAAELVEQNWPAIVRVAEELFRKRTLDKHEIRGLIDRKAPQ